MSAPYHAAPLFRLGRMLLAVAVCASLGLHWAALQTVAWTQMLVKYSQHEALGVAVKKTFDGEHPCGLCLLVKRGWSEEKKNDAPSLAKHLDAVLARQPAIVLLPVWTADFPALVTWAEVWSERPPAPPPRA